MILFFGPWEILRDLFEGFFFNDFPESPMEIAELSELKITPIVMVLERFGLPRIHHVIIGMPDLQGVSAFFDTPTAIPIDAGEFLPPGNREIGDRLYIYPYFRFLPGCSGSSFLPNRFSISRLLPRRGRRLANRPMLVCSYSSVSSRFSNVMRISMGAVEQ